ncbi:MAG TPA: MarR family transcriptional regulator [Candidatus Dormibacteraeota bacterium]|nr:MarR family transcriptional regulator [Candidatus Dormibacteraeota bacterium]
MLADRLHGAALHLMRGIRQADRRLGVGPARLSALSVLLSGPKTLTELAEAEQVSGATISRIAAGLIRTGLARSLPNPDDGRSVRLEMTAAGRHLISRGRRARVARLQAALDRLSSTDRETLDAAIDALERAAWEVLSPSSGRAARSRER